MAADSTPFLETALAVAWKVIPGTVGALVSLRWVPGETFLQRSGAVAGGVAAAVFLAPALTEMAGIVSPKIDAAIAFGLGLFGVTAFHEMAKMMRELELAATARAALRKLLRLDRE